MKAVMFLVSLAAILLIGGTAEKQGPELSAEACIWSVLSIFVIAINYAYWASKIK